MKTKRYILGKSVFSSGSGMPIAFALNLAVLPLFVHMMLVDPLMAAVIIGIIYTTVSIIRLYIIDFVEDRYGLNIRPDYLISKCLHIIHLRLSEAQSFLLPSTTMRNMILSK